MAAPAAQSLSFHEDGSYRFYYETGKEGGSHTRSEIRNPDGVVIGKFSYEDPDGEIREVNYRADNGGYVAQGDVGVKGAPKGQFPAPHEEQPKTPETSSETTDEQIVEQPKPEEVKPQESEQQTEATHDYHDEEADNDDMQDLALEESSANDPPEAFPPGFFLEKFQGLRRFPEPTKEEEPTTTEAPKEEEKQEESEPVEEAKEEKTEQAQSATSGVKSSEGSVVYAPFPGPGFSHQEWASAMFHQPVYVFAYNNPDSYGYHYYF